VDGSLIAALGLGFALGLRHALDADHVVAVSTFVSQDRGVLRSCLRGTFWGLGHTLALLVAGAAVFAFKVQISPELEQGLETLVVLASMPSPAAALAYIVVFGVGSTAGMLVLSGLIGVPFALTAGGSRTLALVLQVVVGTASVLVGLSMIHSGLV
jgi:high-affinity nickel permease